MANDVVLSAALRNNLQSLQGTQRLIDTVQLRLATGLKVNSALDGPQQFFTSQSLNNRASDLTRLLDGINLSIRTIEEADKGITSLTSLVEQATSIAQQAQSEIRSSQGLVSLTGTRDLRGVDLTVDSGGAIANSDDFEIRIVHEDLSGGEDHATIAIATNDTVYDLVATINSTAAINDSVRASVDAQGRLKIESLVEGAALRIADATQSLGADGYAFLGLDNVVGGENLDNVALGRQGGTAISGRTITSAVSAAGTVGGKYEASATLDEANFSATGDLPEIQISIDGDNSANHVLAATATVQELVDAINNDTTINDRVTASFNTDTGRIEFDFAEDVGQAEIILGGAAGDVNSFGFGTGAADATLTGASDFESELFTFVGTSVNLDQYTTDFNTLRDQIDDLVADSNYRGVNLLNGGQLETFFNEDSTSSLVTQGKDLTSLGLGIDEADFIDAADVEEALGQVTNALTAVRNFGTSISNSLSIIQTRRDFTEGTISTLKAGANDLVASDQNEEGANLLALQTRQQLGVTALSLAAQSQQSVLRLF
jgi:flagellin-like hook-associated protein FlgL